MKEKIEANYAGFPDKVTDINKVKYQSLTNDIEKQVKRNPDFKQCTKLMRQWLLYFNDRHLFLGVDDPSEYGQNSPPSFSRIDSMICLLKIPSFDNAHKHNLDSLVKANHALIASTPYLIIDLTDNGGGSDNTYDILLPYVYSKAVTLDLVEMWSSPDNIKQFEKCATDTTQSQEERKLCAERAERMKKHLHSFVNIYNMDTYEKAPETIYSFPKKVAILTDKKNGSSAEQFLLEAKQSSKVITFGTGNTSGTLDYSNLYFEYLPSNKRGVAIPTSRSLRLPQKPFDPFGFSPDVKIDIDTKDKIKFITDYLKRQ